MLYLPGPAICVTVIISEYQGCQSCKDRAVSQANRTEPHAYKPTFALADTVSANGDQFLRLVLHVQTAQRGKARRVRRVPGTNGTILHQGSLLQMSSHARPGIKLSADECPTSKGHWSEVILLSSHRKPSFMMKSTKSIEPVAQSFQPRLFSFSHTYLKLR